MRRAWVVLLLVGCSRGPDGAGLVVERTELDFGTLPQSDYRTIQVAVRNDGRRPVMIESFHIDCACLEAESSAREIAPGATARLTVTFKSASFRGPVEKRFDMHTSAGEVVFTARAFVKPYFLFDPDPIRFGQVPLGERVTREVSMRDAEGRPFKVLAVRSPDGIEAAFEPPGTLRVTACPRSMSLRGGIVRIEVEREGVRRSPEVFVEMEVVSAVGAEPRVVNFGYSPFTPQKVRIVNRTQRPVQIERVSVHGTTAVEWGLDGLEITLTPKPDLPPGRFHGQLLVHIKGVDEPVIVTVTGQVRK